MIIKEVLNNNNKDNSSEGNFISSKVARFVALVLVIATLISTLTVMGVNGAKSSIPEILGAKGTQFTENSYIAGKLQELFELLPYSDYPYFTTYGNKSCGNSSCSYCNGYNVSRYHPTLKTVGLVDAYDSWSCFAFARYAFLYIFGEAANGLNYYGNTKSGVIRRVGRVAANTNDKSSIVGEYEAYTRDTLKELLSKATTGDIVQARSRGSSGVGNHSMLFLKADEDGIYVLQNNAFRNRQSSSGNYYGYNRVMISYYTYETLMGTWNSIVTVYRASEEAYTETWAKGNDVCVDHEYTEEGKNICVNCGIRFEDFASIDDAGIYKLSGKKNLYKEPYASSEKLGSVSGNVVVAARVVNALGETWYKVAGDGYFKDDDIERTSNSYLIKFSMGRYPIGIRKIYDSCAVTGKITSIDEVLTDVSGYIVNSSGKVVQEVNIDLQKVNNGDDATTMDIGSSDLNYKLKFGHLTIGNYVMIIKAEDEDGCMSAFFAPFSVAEKGEEYVKKDVEAPDKPKVEAIMDTYVILEAVEGYEYSMDKKNWQTGNVFSGLEPDTPYNFYCRWAETQITNASPQSKATPIRTLKEQKPADPPKLDGDPGAKEITLVAVKDHEYSIDGGKTWQSSPKFTGLAPATEYTIFQRDKDVKIQSAPLKVKTTKMEVAPPDAPIILGRSDTTISIQFDVEYEYAIIDVKSGELKLKWIGADDGFEGEFTGLKPAREYRIYCRIPETETTFASKASEYAEEKTDKSYRTDVPEIPEILSKNSNSVHVVATKGVEYSLDGENFQKSNVFTDLLPCMVYEIVCRWAETDTTYASEISGAVEFEIIPDVITSTIYNINEEKDVITGIDHNTTVAELLSRLDQGKYATVRNKDGILGGATTITTGDEIVINDMSGPVAKYTLVVKGDANLDGNVNISDLLYVLAMISGEQDPESISFLAADYNGDGRINISDYSRIKSIISDVNQM